MAYKLKIKPKQDAFLLTTEEGVICGIYRTERDANRARPNVKSNIVNYEKYGFLVDTKFKPNRRKKSRRKTKPSHK